MAQFKTLLIFVIPVILFIYITNALFTLACYVLYFYTCCSKPRIICKPNKQNIRILQDCRTVNEMFFPFIFAVFGFVQTFTDRIRNVRKRRKTECVIIQTIDDGIFVVDVYEPTDKEVKIRIESHINKKTELKLSDTNKRTISKLPVNKKIAHGKFKHNHCDELCRMHLEHNNVENKMDGRKASPGNQEENAGILRIDDITIHEEDDVTDFDDAVRLNLKKEKSRHFLTEKDFDKLLYRNQRSSGKRNYRKSFDSSHSDESTEDSRGLIKKINKFIQRRKPITVPRVYFKHSDEECRINQIDWSVGDNEITNIILVHGFNSSSDSNYITTIASHLISDGYRVFGFNSRGTKLPLLTTKFFNIGWTCDLKDCLDYVLVNYTGNIAMVGFSLGGNWTAKLLTELNPIYFNRIKCGMGISMPFDFYKLNSYMSEWPYISINKFITKNLKNYLIKHDVFMPYFNEIIKCNTVQELDKNITGKIFGYTDLDTFYKDGSCGKNIEKIKIPFMVVNASDDPVVPVATIPIDKIKESENVILLLTKNGGHLGFLGYNWDKTYPENIILEFIKVCIGLID